MSCLLGATTTGCLPVAGYPTIPLESSTSRTSRGICLTCLCRTIKGNQQIWYKIYIFNFAWFHFPLGNIWHVYMKKIRTWNINVIQWSGWFQLGRFVHIIYINHCTCVRMVPIMIWWELGLWKDSSYWILFLHTCQNLVFVRWEWWTTWYRSVDRQFLFKDVDMFVECQLVFCCLVVFSYQSRNCQDIGTSFWQKHCKVLCKILACGMNQLHCNYPRPSVFDRFKDPWYPLQPPIFPTRPQEQFSFFNIHFVNYIVFLLRRFAEITTWNIC